MAGLQKEIRIRRRIEGIYNKDQQDFPDLRSFGDYEEEKEDIIFNLSQGIDVEATEAKVAAYQRANHDEIMLKAAKKAENQLTSLEDRAPSTSEKPLESEEADRSDNRGGTEPIFQPLESLQPRLPPPPAMLAPENQELEAGAQPQAADEREAVGLVSGWHPDMPRDRALEEAYTTIFVL